MRPVAHAIAEHKPITSVPLPLIPLLVPLENLESSAKDARKENIKRMPAIKLLDFMRFMIRSDITIRASGEMPSEAGDSTPFATDVAQQVSPTVEELKPLSSADAVQWMDYWAAAGMFK